MATSLRLTVEQGLVPPQSVRDGTHAGIAQLLAAKSSSDLIVSAARFAHPLDYFDADFFVRVSAREDRLPPPPPPLAQGLDELMRLAATARRESSARVGAALLTEKGTVLCSVERRSSAWGSARGMMIKEIEDEVQSLEEGPAKRAVELLDMSTSIHAEALVLWDCLSKQEKPAILATTRLPCLACCRTIRLAGVPYTTYLTHRGLAPPGQLRRSLIEDALDGHVIELYEGIGGRGLALSSPLP